MTEKEKKKSGEISRREFLKDAGLLVGGTAIGSTVLLAACGGDDGATETVTKTVTSTAPGGTATVTKTEQVGEVTKTETTTVTQSKFVCPIDNMEFDSLAALKAHFESEHGGEIPPALNTMKFIVNGDEHELQVEPEWTLQYVIHDKLGLIGTKLGCDHGVCGSCAVIIDGKPVLSCMTLAIESGGKSIETVEGVAQTAPALIEAYVKHECMQCGYCTPGFVVTAKALLDRNPDPNEDEIKQALAGNLCRCGTYPVHPIAIMEAAQALKGGG